MAKIPFLKSMDEKCLDEVLENTTILDCVPGDTIISEGSDDRALYILLKGRVRVMKDDRTVAVVGESGQLLGEIALVRDEARSATILAESQAYCLKVKPEFLEQLSSEDRNAFYAYLYKFVAMLLADRLTETTNKLAKSEEQLQKYMTTD